MSKKILKELVCNSIDDHRKEILRIPREIQNRPELGFKEEYLSKKIGKILEKLELEVKHHIALTGCKATVNEDLRGPNLAVFAALDAGFNPEHPGADAEGVVHNGGNNLQVAMMIGVAFGLIKSHVVQNLDGKVTFVAVPAQEAGDLDYRKDLIEKGQVRYRFGIQELLKKQCFDDITIALSVQPMDLRDKESKMIISPKYPSTPEYDSLGVIFQENAKLFYNETQMKWSKKLQGKEFLNILELSKVMPALQPLVGGVRGIRGGADFELMDKDTAYLIPAKIMALTIVDLLYDNAKKTRKVLKNSNPPNTIKEYLAEINNA